MYGSAAQLSSIMSTFEEVGLEHVQYPHGVGGTSIADLLRWM